MTLPVVLSVIIPVHNGDRFIAECLSSVLEFRGAAIEVIVVNDGSTDRTGRILAQFSDRRLKIIEQEKSGVSAARNRALNAASGEFVLPIDADDIAIAANWTLLIDALWQKPDAVLVYGARHVFEDEGREIPKQKAASLETVFDDYVVPNIFTRNFMQMGSAIIRRDAVIAAGGWNEDLTVAEDWDLWSRLACRGRFLFCPILVIGYRRHQQSAMGMSIERCQYDPALSAIDTMFSDPLVQAKAAKRLPRLKRRAIGWQTYHWGTRLVRNGHRWHGIKSIAWSIPRDPTRFVHILGFPLRRLNRMVRSRLRAGRKPDYRTQHFAQHTE